MPRARFARCPQFAMAPARRPPRLPSRRERALPLPLLPLLQVCGDTGGATRLVLCENADRGCLGGVHLYCCMPLRSEPPTDAWHCAECSAALVKATALAQQRAKQRAAEANARRQARQQQKRRRKEEQQLRRSQQQAAGAAARSNAAVAAAARRAVDTAVKHNKAASGPEAAATSAVPAALARPQLAQPHRPAASAPSGPSFVPARTDTLALLFESMKSDSEAAQRRAQEMGRVVDGTSRRMALSASEREEQRGLLAAKHSLESCQAAGLNRTFALRLPLAHQKGSFDAPLLFYAIPGNLHSTAATARLDPLATAASAGQQPVAYLLSMDELGERRLATPWCSNGCTRRPALLLKPLLLHVCRPAPRPGVAGG